jgi:prepilin-type N-terminal cleavage/methylation domain-containing protein
MAGGKMKKGFGLIEVLAAAVVLGFLVVGLTQLQKGNREGILRVRSRDAANFVAQRVLDSLGTLGINSLQADGNRLVFGPEEYIYTFEGKNVGEVRQAYTVSVLLLDTPGEHSVTESTHFTTAARSEVSMAGEYTDDLNVYNKKLEATVTWNFKNHSQQSIVVAKVVR